MVTAYITATEFRNLTNLSSNEYSDAQIEQLILSATVEIDKRTGRTWQCETTVTNELYDGDGTNELDLNQVDIIAISSIEIDKNYDGSYVSVDPDYALVYSKRGGVLLDSERNSGIEVDSFVKGRQTVRVTYVYGHSAPDDLVKNLCALLVLQQLRPDQNLEKVIENRISLLRANSIKNI